MIDKLIEVGRCYVMEISVEKTKVKRISGSNILSNHNDGRKTTGEFGIF
jgi:hypothetical protein